MPGKIKKTVNFTNKKAPYHAAIGTEGEQNIPCQNRTTGIQDMPPQRCHLGILIILSCRHFKKSKWRDSSSNSLICLKAELSKPTQLSSIPSLEVSSTGEDWLTTREETGCWHKLTNFVTNSPSSHLLFKGPFILPKYHSLSLKRLRSVFPFAIKMV